MDFTLKKYCELLTTLQNTGYVFVTYADFCGDKIADRLVVLRHDVDRNVPSALEMAKLENTLGVKASYYFREKFINTRYFNDILTIANLGHEIGYHYEDLVLEKGDIDKAYARFVRNVDSLKEYVDIKTITMHGSPMSSIDSKEMWRVYDYRSLGLIGEPQFDVDWSKMVYLTDTGRSWSGVSRRDKIVEYESYWRDNGWIYNATNDMIKALKRHINGETLGKIFGFIEFHGNFFNVTENVFDPRLSTEALVDAVVDSETAKKQNVKIIDLCTGSGCVAITISKLLNQKVDAIDISPFALEIARENNEKNQANANFFEMYLDRDWNKYIHQKYDIIVSNPPYWNAEKILRNINVVADNPLAGFDGGEDGLHFIKKIIQTAPEFLNQGGELFLEIEPDQEDNVRKMLEQNFCEIKTFLDYRKITRVISAKLK